MANPSFDDDDEKPLDPAVARVERRVRRLILIAGLTLGLGIVAVFAAILYRIATYDATGATATSAGVAVPALTAAAMGLPADARLVATALDGNRLALTYASADGTHIVVIDVRSGAVVSRVKIEGRWAGSPGAP